MAAVAVGRPVWEGVQFWVYLTFYSTSSVGNTFAKHSEGFVRRYNHFINARQTIKLTFEYMNPAIYFVSAFHTLSVCRMYPLVSLLTLKATEGDRRRLSDCFFRSVQEKALSKIDLVQLRFLKHAVGNLLDQ